MESLPKTYDEFLQFEGLKDWPKLLPDEEEFNMNIQPEEFTSYESVLQYVHEHAPLQMELLTNMGQRIDELAMRLEKYASKILPDEPRKTKANAKTHLFYLPETFIRQMKNSDALLLNPSRKLSEELDIAHKSKTVEASGIKQSSWNLGLSSTDYFSVLYNRNEECSFCNERNDRWLDKESQTFPGFKPLEFTKLPGHLETMQLLYLLRKTYTFSPAFQATWKKLILSEPSVAILQDAFWWFFLYKFKPSREDQDYLFSRIADSFVTLLMITPVEVLDMFFQVYPDCLSQAIFAVFYKSFPGSHNKFGDEFKSELTELISLWLTGLKPKEFSWRKWNLGYLENSMSMEGSEIRKNILAELDLKARRKTFIGFTKAYFRNRTSIWQNSLYSVAAFRFKFDLDEEIANNGNLTKGDPPTLKASAPLHKIESSYVGLGPEFRHVLFRVSGRSPLVSHFLNMKKIVGRRLGTTGPKLKWSEISKHSPLHPTYKDVITEAEKVSKDLHQKHINLQKQTQRAIAKIKWDQIQINKKIDRLKKELFKTTNKRIPSKPVKCALSNS